MTRPEAAELVKQHTHMVQQYAAVSYDAARQLLGESKFAVLTTCKIHGIGPAVETIYPWNVIDVLENGKCCCKGMRAKWEAIAIDRDGAPRNRE